MRDIGTASSRAVRRSGFTLVEMLVVIAIIGILMGILLPAVQSAREAARRNTCTNNQAQLGRGVIAFDGVRGFIPGWRNAAISSANTATYAWPILLMPNIERRDVFNAISGTSGAGVSANSSITPYIDIFVCPTSPPDSLASPIIHYMINASGGTNRGDAVAFDTTSTKVGIEYVSGGDGLANTLLFSEKCGPTTGVGWWSFSVGPFNATPQVGASGSSTPVIFLPSATTGTALSGKVVNNSTFNNTLPNSQHPGGAMAAFCDAHTLFIKDSIAPRVLSQLMTSKSSDAQASYNSSSFTYVLTEADVK